MQRALNFNAGSGGTVFINGSNTPTINFGANSFTMNYAVTSGSFIQVPITGSGDITVNFDSSGSGQLEFANAMSGFTGGLTVDNHSTGSGGPSATANIATLDLASDLGASSSIIKLASFVQLTNDNSASSGTQPIQYAISRNITLNYNAVAGGTNWISGSNGTTGTGGNAGVQRIETFTGVITSPSTVTTNVIIGSTGTTSGGRETVLLANQNTWTGPTSVGLASNNGLLQLGVTNALPTTTTLTFGVGAATSSAPMDLNGNSQTLAGLKTVSTITNIQAGNIYNTYPLTGSETPVTLTLNTTGRKHLRRRHRRHESRRKPIQFHAAVHQCDVAAVDRARARTFR